MKTILLILSVFIAISLPISAKTAPVKPTPTTVAPGTITRTAEQEAQLKDWIIGIQKLADDAQTKADAAEKAAEDSRAQLDAANQSLTNANGQLKDANANADTLQKAIDAQTNQLNEVIAEVNQDKAEITKLTKENAMLKDIIGVQVALVILLVCLYLRVPSLAMPWGLVGTLALAAAGFTAIKLFL